MSQSQIPSLSKYTILLSAVLTEVEVRLGQFSLLAPSHDNADYVVTQVENIIQNIDGLM